VSRPPERDPEKRPAQRALWAALAAIENHRPPPPPAPPLEPEAWKLELQRKAEALAAIETFRPWWWTPTTTGEGR